MDEYFAELLGAFAGDGWMSKGNSGISLFITGHPIDEKEYYDKRIKFLFKKVFGVEVLPRSFPYWGTYGVCIGKGSITKSFISAGMIVGKKAHKVTVPKEILKNKKLYANFIRGLFDTDGSIYFAKSYNQNASKWQKTTKHIPVIRLVSVSKNLILQLKEMLNEIGLDLRYRCYPPTNGNYYVNELEIKSKSKAKNFFRLILPKNSKHLNKFKIWLSQGFYSVS